MRPDCANVCVADGVRGETVRIPASADRGVLWSLLCILRGGGGWGIGSLLRFLLLPWESLAPPPPFLFLFFFFFVVVVVFVCFVLFFVFFSFRVAFFLFSSLLPSLPRLPPFFLDCFLCFFLFFYLSTYFSIFMFEFHVLIFNKIEENKDSLLISALQW